MGAVKRYLEDVTESLERKQYSDALAKIQAWATDETEQASLALYTVETLASVFGNVSPEIIPCPRHAGAYDCTPFCGVCHGTQETAVTR